MRSLLALAFPALLIACGGDPSDPPAVGTLERDRLELVAESDDPVAEILVRVGSRPCPSSWANARGRARRWS